MRTMYSSHTARETSLEQAALRVGKRGVVVSRLVRFLFCGLEKLIVGCVISFFGC